MIAAAQGLGELKSFKNLKNSPLNSSDFIVKKGEKSFRLNVSNVLEGGVKFDGFILAVTDITHEKELEKKELEHRRSVLAHAKTALVGEMINSISHQQRQPLSALGCIWIISRSARARANLSAYRLKSQPAKRA